MSYKPRLTVYPTIRIRNVCAIFRMHVVQIQHRFYKFSTNFKVTRKFLQNKKLHLSESGVFFIFPQDAKKRNMTAFGVPKGGAKISTEQDSFFADLQYFAYQENMDGFLHSQEH